MSTAAKVIAVAKKEVGYREGPNNKTKYPPQVPSLEWAQNQPWCATFVAWCAQEAGAKDLYPVTASCDVAGKWFKDQGRWSEYPGIGAQAFFGYPHDLNHTGIVYAYDHDYIYTVEGNTNDSGSREGNGVYLKKRARRGANIIGYGYPKFSEGIASADPAYAKPVPAKKPDKDQPLRRALLEAEKAARKVGRKPLAERLKARRISLRPKKEK